MEIINIGQMIVSSLFVITAFFICYKKPILNPLVKCNDGKWHCVKYNRISRDGGIILFLFLLVISNPFTDWMLYLMIAFVFCVGVLDDIYPLSIVSRLLTYLSISLGIVSTVDFGTNFLPHILLVLLLCVLFITFTINAFNIIDNMDGVCIISFSICSLFLMFDQGIDVNNLITYLPLLIVVIYTPVFLVFNLKGKIMLGNSGSTVLGFIIGILAVTMVAKGMNPYKLLFYLFYPIFDFSFVVIRRLIEGRAPWIGGADHTSHAFALELGENWALFYIGLLQISMGVVGVYLL